MQRRNFYAPSVADTMSVASLPSIKGSVYGDRNDAFRNQPNLSRPPLPQKPPLPIFAP